MNVLVKTEIVIGKMTFRQKQQKYKVLEIEMFLTFLRKVKGWYSCIKEGRRGSMGQAFIQNAWENKSFQFWCFSYIRIFG
jgi:hypothetical protein